MGGFTIGHWLIVLAIFLLLFGRGKIPELMGDVAKGIKNFKKGMAEDPAAQGDGVKTIPGGTETPVAKSEDAHKV
jgi:sec-independent protein translocase protein TatA